MLTAPLTKTAVAAALGLLLLAELPRGSVGFSTSSASRPSRVCVVRSSTCVRPADRVSHKTASSTTYRDSAAGRASRSLGALRMADTDGKVVFVCTGDDCEESGADQILKYARKTKPEGVVCKSTGCLGMCGQGPAVCIPYRFNERSET
jgi:hypothetical protein